MRTETQPTARDATFTALAVVCTFVSACLLFMVQPMLAKWLLPSLGGTPATWSVCLATFQLLLLAGYGYVHWAALHLAPRALARAQLALIPTACFALWQTDWSAPSPNPSALSVLGVLVTRIGLPYFLLATTLPLLSHWAATRGRRAIATLNVSSNSGAFVGLLSYPFLIEPAWAVQRQLSLWSDALLVFGALMLAACSSSLFVALPTAPTSDRPGALQLSRWLLCALVPSALLLAATNHITTDIAATPLFWVVPLASYLLSFVIAFAVWRDTWRAPTVLLWGVATAALAVNAFTQGATSFTQQMLATLLSTFAACLLCHGELAQTRPTTGLSLYYLIIAGGGALGGMLVGLIAPVALEDHYELELISLAIPIVLLVSSHAAPAAWNRSQRLYLALTAGLCAPLLLGSLWVRAERETHGS
ncbi:MAG TPA: hypothetical protein VHO25_18585, partial [Polyangiaceae bacterium]|nr:hypothetical protein [Polyangiaceae bacterium]